MGYALGAWLCSSLAYVLLNIFIRTSDYRQLLY